jgi:hypothetical protein
LDILLEAFKKKVRGASAEIAVVHRLQVDPLRPVQVPPGDFYEFIRRAPPGGVIVSFLGPPLLLQKQRERLGAIKPKIVAFCTGDAGGAVNLEALFSSGLLHAAVVRRPANPNGARAPATFDELYATVTAGNVSQFAPVAPGS